MEIRRRQDMGGVAEAAVDMPCALPAEAAVDMPCALPAEAAVDMPCALPLWPSNAATYELSNAATRSTLMKN
jgi:hypothetical protein